MPFRLFALLLGASAAIGTLGACNGPDVRHMTVDGIDREYLVHVPPQVSPDVRPAMVIMLHGTSGDGVKFYNTSHWVETADQVASRWKECQAAGDCPKREKNERGGVITVFPSSLAYCIADELHPGGSDWVVTTKWNSGEIGTPALPFCPSKVIADLRPYQRIQIATLKRNGNQYSQEMADDVKFIRILVERLSSQYNVDPERIYVAGFSNGGQFSTRLGLEMSDVFAAVGTAAGPPDTVGVAPVPVPIIGEVGTKDPLFIKYRDPKDPGIEVDEIPFSERAWDVAGFRYFATRMAKQAGLNPDVYTVSRDTINGVQTLKFSFDEPTRGYQNHAELILSKGVSHQFPAGDSNPLVLANVFWDFFREYQQPEGRGGAQRGGKARERGDDEDDGRGGKAGKGKGNKGKGDR